MKGSNILALLSLWAIANIWRKRMGVYYNKKNRIICRFYPTCSEYAVKALNKYGFIRGWFLAYKRVKRCTAYNTESCYDLP